jgi:hypothetical protein
MELSHEEIDLLEKMKNEMDVKRWREFIFDLTRIKRYNNWLPINKKWEISSKTLNYLVTLYSQIIKEEVGLDAYYRISKEVWREVGKLSKDVIFDLKIDLTDASSVHFGVRNFSRIIMGPRLDFEVIHASRARSVIRIYNCPWHNIMIETGVQSFCEPHHEIHEMFCQSLIESLNPLMIFKFTQHINSQNLSYCEEVVEFRSKGVIRP